MKKTLLIALLVSTGAIAQTQQFYGTQGQLRGTAMTSGNTTYIYNATGASVGTVMNQVAPLTMPVPMYLPQPYTQATPTYVPPSLTPIYDSVYAK